MDTYQKNIPVKELSKKPHPMMSPYPEHLHLQRRLGNADRKKKI